MPATPGSKVYRITSVLLDESGTRSRVHLGVGVVPSAGATTYASRVAVLDLSGPEFAALRGLIAAQLAASPPAALEGAVAEPV